MPESILETLSINIDSFKCNEKYNYDIPALITVKEALKSAKEGNYGVGACIYNKLTGEIIETGRNKMFFPYFKSDMHAEMNALNKFEDNLKEQYPLDLSNLVLFASLEPCPMCLTRIINSGFSEVEYLASDPQWGMINLMEHLPLMYQKISKNRIYKQTKCSQELIDIANQIFLFTDNIINLKAN